jgi:hypothetical protein
MTRVIKRVLQSLLGGVLILVLYVALVLVIVSIVTAISGNAPVDSKWFWILCLPLEWAGHSYNYLFPPEFEKQFGELRVQVFLANIIADVFVGILLTHLFLCLRPKIEPMTQSSSDSQRFSSAKLA